MNRSNEESVSSNSHQKHLILLPEPDIQQEVLAPLPIKIEKHNVLSQTDNEIKCDRGDQTEAISIQAEKETMRYSDLSADDLYFFTGLKLSSFKELVEFLNISSITNDYILTMSNYDQLIVTLIKLRHKFEFNVLAKMYGIHQDIIREIFVLWINIMCNQFRKTDLWSLRDEGDTGYTAILNCFEIPCQSNNTKLNDILKSVKDKRLTLKYLVATDSLGTVIFCSNQLFGGSMTDRQVILLSGLLTKLKEDDKILSETNFGIGDIIKANRIVFHRSHESRNVEKARICMEGVIGMTKYFGILQGVFPADLMPYAPTIFYVSTILINFINETNI